MDPKKPAATKPLQVRESAKEALEAVIAARGGGTNRVQLVSDLLMWLREQPAVVVDAVLRSGAGTRIHDADEVRRKVWFGDGPAGESRAAGPPKAGQQSRTTESRRGSGRVA